MKLLILIVLVLILANSIKKSEKHPNRRQHQGKEGTIGKENTVESICSGSSAESEEMNDIDFKKAYQAKYLLTKNEWHEFKVLQKIAEEKGYMICPKVRLLDIIEPIKGHEKYRTLFYKVQAKHVDFVICDKDVHIKAILELDDASHNREDRKERDRFVDEILESVGYRVIHTKAITPEILDLE